MTSSIDNPIPVLDLSPQIESLWDEINEAVQRVIRSGQFIQGPDVKAFEQEVAEYLGVKHAIGVNSGTDALVIALRSLNIGSGDEVITTPFSFFATAESISSVGAKPVFVDIEECSMNIDFKLIESAITSKTKAIMPVHIFGRPAAMSQIMEIADKYNLKVIEDCAQSFGARYSAICNNCNCSLSYREKVKGKHTGTIGHVGAYSFFPSKNLGAFGDGGLLVTNDDDIAEKSRMLHKHGAKRKYHNQIIGYNSRLDTIQAAILRVKLPYIDLWNSQRVTVASRYNEALKGVDGIVVPNITDGHVFHQYSIRFTKDTRDTTQAVLKEHGVNTMVYYPIPQDKLPVYKGKYGTFYVSEKLAQNVLSLPIWPKMPFETQQKVINCLKETILDS